MKVMLAQIRMDTATSTVPAFLRYIHVRSQQCVTTLRRVGTRYGGNSMTNGVDSPRMMVERIRRAMRSAAAQPANVSRNMVRAGFSGKNTPTSSRNTGSLAPHAI